LPLPRHPPRRCGRERSQARFSASVADFGFALVTVTCVPWLVRS
jgi:hypothetical protein